MFSNSRFKVENEQKISRRLNMAKLFYQNQDYVNANNYINEILKSKPDCAEAYKLLSKINEASGDHDMAMLNYKKSLDLSVSNDLNSSFEHFKNHVLTPTKTSSPANFQSPIDNHQNNVELSNISFEKIAKLINEKFSLFENNFKEYFDFLKSSLVKNEEDVSAIKKEVTEIQKKLVKVSTKNEQHFKQLSSNINNLNESVKLVSENLNVVSKDSEKIGYDLDLLRESVQGLHIKMDHEADEEEDYYDDQYENENIEPVSINQQVNKNSDLFQFLKPKSNNWECSSCSVYNDITESRCSACETERFPNEASNSAQSNVTNNFSIKFGVEQPSISFNPTPLFNFPNPPVFNNPNNSLLTSNNNSAFSGNFSFGSPNKPDQSVVTNGPTTNLFSNFSFGNIGNANIGQQAGRAPLFQLPQLNSKEPAQTNGFSNASNQMLFGSSVSQIISSKGFEPIIPLQENKPDKKENVPTKDNTREDIEIVYTKEFKKEFEDLVTRLKLPKNFYDYHDKPPCKGCIGCKVDELDWNNITYSDTSETSAKGLFSNMTNDVVETKVDNISENRDSVDNSESSSFVLPLEKRKLLPTNYTHQTGEENEETMFCSRAKLYRFDKGTSQWKERGIGEIKILKQKNEEIYRILMRREIILNLICNHRISPALKWQDFPKVNHLSWFATDFSEETNGVDEIFTVKFKNEDLMKEFKQKVTDCISKKA